MASTYSPDLRIELIGTGDQAGIWGATTNTNLGTLLEAAIAGYTSVAVASANQAFTANNGAADQARNASIALTTSTGANFAVYAPASPKLYVVYNASSYTATIYNSTVTGNTTAAGTGVSIPAGKTVAVWSDGTNFLLQTTYLGGCTGLPISTGVTGLGTGIAAALAVNVGSAGAPILNGGALGTPSSGNLANCTFPTLNQNTTGNAATATSATTATSAGSLATSNFSVVESGGKLYFKYNGTSIASLDSSGNFTSLANVTAYGTP